MSIKFKPYGNTKIPFSEPSWYRGAPTPFFNEYHDKWRRKVRNFVEKELKPFASKWTEEKYTPIVLIRKRAYKAGILSPYAPVELGGTPPEGGWDSLMLLIWVDELMRSGITGAITCIFTITYMSLPHTLRYGSRSLIDRVARPCLRGEACICVALTEPHGGSDLASIQTTASKTDDGKFYVVNGAKKFITSGMDAAFFSTLVRIDGTSGTNGICLMIIDADIPGVSVRKLKTQGWWAGNTTLVTFNDVMVPVGNLIGKEGKGFKYMVDVMNGERLILSTEANRLARMCLEEAIKFARQRKTFGKRLIDHQIIRNKIAHMARKVETTQALLENYAFFMANGAQPRDIGGPMALAKVQATQTLEFCAREASQILGGASYLRQGKGQVLERIVREVRVNVVGGGSEEILIDLAMRQCKL